MLGRHVRSSNESVRGVSEKKKQDWILWILVERGERKCELSGRGAEGGFPTT